MYKRTVWSEGMFLGPHHLQQQDRYFHSLIEAVSRAGNVYRYGFTELEIDHAALAEGKLRVLRCAGLFSDGTPFSLDAEHERPAPLTVEPNQDAQIISLALPSSSRDKKEISAALTPHSLARYVLQEQEVEDTHSLDSDGQEKLLTARLWVRLLSSTTDQSSWETLPIARVKEIQGDGSLVLDSNFQPCALILASNPPLTSICRELNALLKQRANDLATRLGTPSAQDTSLLSGFMLLQVINRAAPLFEHFLQGKSHHPETVYRQMIQLVGEVSTITLTGRLPPTMAEYRHRDQQYSFYELASTLKKALDWVPDSITENIPVECLKPGIYTATVHDLNLFQSAKFLLAVKSDLSPNEIQSFFPQKTTIASREKLKTLVTSHTPGLSLVPLASVPSNVPVFDDQVCFRLEGDPSLFKEISVSGIFAIHTAGNYPNLNLQMWALKQ